MRQIGYRQLGWQANAVAACTLVQLYTFNFALEQPLWPGVSLRLATVSLVAAGLYFLSRQSLRPIPNPAARLLICTPLPRPLPLPSSHGMKRPMHGSPRCGRYSLSC